MNKLVMRSDGHVDDLPSGLVEAIIADARFWPYLPAEEEIAALTETLREVSFIEGPSDERCKEIVVNEAINHYKRHAPELVSLIEAHPNDRWSVVEVDAPGYLIITHDDDTEHLVTAFTSFDS